MSQSEVGRPSASSDSRMIGRKTVLNSRWLVFGVAAAAYFISYFHRVAPAVVATNLMADLGMTGVGLGTLNSMYFWVYAVVQIPVGVLVDTLGARKTMVLGSATMAVGSIVFAAAPVDLVAYFGRFLVGLGAAGIFISVMKLLASWFAEREFGTLSGFTLMTGNIGALFAGAPLAIGVAAFGWRVDFIIVGVVTAIVAVACAGLIRNHPPVPRDSGRIGALGSNPTSGQATESGPARFRGYWLDQTRAVVKNKYSWPPVFAQLGLYSTLITFLGLWGVPFLTQVYGETLQQAANVTTAMSLGVIVGCPLIGYSSDRLLGRRRPLYFGTVGGCTVMWALLVFFRVGDLPDPLLYGFFFLFGTTYSAIALTWPCSKEVNHPDLTGVAVAVANTACLGGAAVLPTIVGAMLDSGWGGVVQNGVRIYPASAYQWAFLLCFLLMAVGAGAALLTKETRCRNIYSTLKKPAEVVVVCEEPAS